MLNQVLLFSVLLGIQNTSEVSVNTSVTLCFSQVWPQPMLKRLAGALMSKHNSSACPARACHILVHFLALLVLTST